MFQKSIIVLTATLLTSLVTWASGPVQVKGYTRKDGTYVAPHTRALPGNGTGTPPPIARTEAPSYQPPQPRTTPPTLTPSPEHASVAAKPVKRGRAFTEGDDVMIRRDNVFAAMDRETAKAAYESREYRRSLALPVTRGLRGKVFYVAGDYLRFMSNGQGYWVHRSNIYNSSAGEDDDFQKIEIGMNAVFDDDCWGSLSRENAILVFEGGKYDTIAILKLRKGQKGSVMNVRDDFVCVRIDDQNYWAHKSSMHFAPR